MTEIWRRNARRARTLLLWLALIACGIVLAQNRSQLANFGLTLGLLGWSLLFSSLTALWFCAVLGWVRVNRAYGHSISLRSASRQVALLLLGKYLPGGIWGFAARLFDATVEHALGPMLAAGIAEQCLNLGSLALLSAVGLLAAASGADVLFALAGVVPFAVISSVLLLQRVMDAGPVRRCLPKQWRQLRIAQIAFPGDFRAAAWLACLQQACVIAIAAIPLSNLFPDAHAVAAVACCYGLAISAGIAVVLVPGGILVREGVFVALSSPWLRTDDAMAVAAALRLLFMGFDMAAGAAGAALNTTTNSQGRPGAD